MAHGFRTLTSIPPEHYTVSIKSFSSLASEETYESGEFKAGGYKWKLVIFPNGNKNNGIKDHISLYLKMAGKKSIKPSKIVTINYKLFLLKRYKAEKNYIFLEDSYPDEEKKCLFYKTIIGGLAGFDKFLTLKDFKDPTNGYLNDDVCEFGAEVFVTETKPSKTKGENLYMNLDNSRNNTKHGWTIRDFSKLPILGSVKSPPFVIENQSYCKWHLELYPKGKHGTGTHLSVFLKLSNGKRLPKGSQILAGFTLRIKNQMKGQDWTRVFGPCWFKSSPENGFCSWGDVDMITQEENKKMMKNDGCKIEVEIKVVGVSMPAGQ